MLYTYINHNKNHKEWAIPINCNLFFVPSSKKRLGEGSSSIFGHIFTRNYSKIETGFYFAFSSLTLQAFIILFFSYI